MAEEPSGARGPCALSMRVTSVKKNVRGDLISPSLFRQDTVVTPAISTQIEGYRSLESTFHYIHYCRQLLIFLDRYVELGVPVSGRDGVLWGLISSL
jgi:hypothetical protein